MFWLIISIIAFIGAFIGTGIYEDEHYNFKWKLNKNQWFALFALLIMLPGFITKIPANTVGVVYSPFGGTKDHTLSEGFSKKNILDKVYKISTEVQTMSIENLTTQTKDAQYLNSSLDIKYRVDAANAHLIFKQFRTLDKMSETLIKPTSQRILELVTTKYNVIDILGEKRSTVYSELEVELKNEFAKYGVEFYSISITDMDAGEAIENAITEEAVAKKAVETAEQNLLKVETEAKQKTVEAQANQEAAKINAETRRIEAEAEKKVNDLMNESLTDEILRRRWIDKWDGKMPTYYAGGKEANLMIGIE